MEHWRGGGTEMRLEQAWIKHQEWLKPSLKRESIFSSCFCFFYISAGVGAWLLTPQSSFCKASVAWVRGNPVWGDTLPLTEGVPAPGTACCRGKMGCGTRTPPSPLRQSEPLRTCSPNLSQAFKHAECILHLSKKCGMICRVYKCYKSKWTLFIPMILEVYQ